MMNAVGQLRDDALAIWQAGVDAVRSDRLVTHAVRVEDDNILVGDQVLPTADIGRIVVVGCGKAGAGMAAGLETALGDPLLEQKQIDGWINVPDDCVQPLKRIHLHGARPAGVNEPTQEGVEGAERILGMIRSLSADDLCLCLISGGGSALLPAPVEGITLADKLAVTRHLSAAGANIQQLNTVRKQLSCIKGGGLARACGAGRLIALIISDVLGDPLDVIASGLTVEDPSTPQDALEVLNRFDARSAGIPSRVLQYLQKAAVENSASEREAACRVTNLVIGNNATSVRAAGEEAVRRGYQTRLEPIEQLEGEAEGVGRDLAEEALRMSQASGRLCLISGGEPTVRLAEASQRGRGGRNQQLVLAALERLMEEKAEAATGIALLSGGTDGEDGPTDAAGAVLDADVIAAVRAKRLTPADYLRRNDAYRFFDPLDALIRTGPTHTNVCDLRVVATEGRGQRRSGIFRS
jgi:hydroxypyruvate reductase